MRSTIIFGALALGALAACSSPRGGDGAASPDEPVTTFATREDPIAPIEAPSGLDPRRVALGEKLFDDTILSGDGTASCRTCHLFDRGGADGRDHSKLDK